MINFKKIPVAYLVAIRKLEFRENEEMSQGIILI